MSFEINSCIKFVLIDPSLKSRIAKEISSNFSKYNKITLITTKSIPSDNSISLTKVSSWTEKELKKIKTIEKNFYFFDLTDRVKSIDKTIQAITKLNLAPINKTTKKKKNEDNKIYFIFNITLFSLNRDVYCTEFIRNFNYRILKSSRSFNKYIPDTEMLDYSNDECIVLTEQRGFKTTPIIVDILEDNYEQWFKENFYYLQDYLKYKFYLVDNKHSLIKRHEILNKIFEEKAEDEIMELKNNKNLLKIKLNNLILLIIFVEGHSDKIFLEKFIEPFIFINIKVIPIARNKDDSWESFKFYNDSNYKYVYIWMITDHDDEGEKYRNRFIKKYKDDNTYKYLEPISYEKILIPYKSKKTKEKQKILLEDVYLSFEAEKIILSSQKSLVGNDKKQIFSKINDLDRSEKSIQKIQKSSIFENIKDILEENLKNKNSI